MSRLKSTLLLLIICTTINVQAQTPGSSLAQQYQDVVVKSGSYQGFKEIRQDKIELFWRNIQDTLTREKQLRNEANAKIQGSAQTVKQSKRELESVQKQLEESKASVNTVNLLGIPVDKATYSMIMWGIVGLLAAGLAFAIYRSKSSINEARYRTGLFNDLTEEFQKHKAAANEKEKKLAREVQTERNRIAELTGK
ncbi:MAG: hypothetical protein WBJ10_04700 [Daejeonella sp.]|uniref:hypothetical protein n=1 Tax=Daejeonella sp. TaxID=2805397 RepID=UPI003C71FD91